MLGTRHACVSDLTLVFSLDSGLQGPRHPSECIPFHSAPPFQLRFPAFSPRTHQAHSCLNVFAPAFSSAQDALVWLTPHSFRPRLGSDPTPSMRPSPTTLCRRAIQSPELSCPLSLLFFPLQCFSPLNIPLLIYYTVMDSVSELACELQQFRHLC